MKKHRQLFIGVLIGIIVSTGITAFGTSVIRNSYFNPDLKLAINGKPVQDLRIVTVELEGEQYGRNYYSIADLVKAFNDYGGINVKIDFDANTKTTIIEVEQKETETKPEATPTPEPIKPVEPTGTIELNNSMEGGENDIMEVPLTIYGLPDFSNYKGVKPELDEDESFVYDGVKYIRFMKVKELLNDISYIFSTYTKDNDETVYQRFRFLKGTDNGSNPTILIEEVPYGKYDRQQYYITEDYYINTILPVTKGE